MTCSAIEISTCGVRKCIGGVALLSERFPLIDSPLSLQAPLVLTFPLLKSIDTWFAEVELITPILELSKSIPCLKVFNK